VWHNGGARYLFVLLAAAAGGLLMVVAWRRFIALLKRAEQFAEAATCPQCKAWGKFRVLGQTEPEEAPPEAGQPHWSQVRCTKANTRLG
jgi:hypothetical protein